MLGREQGRCQRGFAPLAAWASRGAMGWPVRYCAIHAASGATTNWSVMIDTVITQVPRGFSGFIWEPANEQQVVLLFAMLLAQRKFAEPLCIESADTTFPDCEAVNTDTGEPVKIEFEFRSKDFLKHKEWDVLRACNPAVRWMVVCWEDNFDGAKPDGLQVVSLQSFAADPEVVLKPVPDHLRGTEAASERFDWRAAALGSHERDVLAQLRHFGESKDTGFCIAYREGSASTRFSVVHKGHGEIGFGGNARGTVGIPFSKWSKVGDDVKLVVIEELNKALPHLRFDGHGNRKKGYDINVLLSDQAAVTRFLQAWRNVVLQLDRAAGLQP